MKRLVLIGLCVFITGTALADWDVGYSVCKLEQQYPYHEIGDDALAADICFWTLESQDSSAAVGTVTVVNAFQAGDSDEKWQIQINVPDIEDVCIQDEAGMYGHVFSVVVDKYETSWDVNSDAACADDGAWQDLLDRWIRL